MNALKKILLVAVMSALATSSAWAQTPPTGQPPTGQPPTGQPPTGQPPTGQPPTGQPPTGQPPTGQPPTQPPPTQPPATQPPATQPPATQPPAAQPKPPAPFPEGAKIAWVDIQVVAQSSAEGKAATAKIQEFNKKKSAEIQEKTKALQALQAKLQQGGSVMNDSARSQLEKDIDKATRDLQFFQQDAQAEQQTLTNDLQNEFQQKLAPIIEQVATEKGLHMVLSIRDSGAIWAQPGLDISSEVVKRFDASRATTKK